MKRLFQMAHSRFVLHTDEKNDRLKALIREKATEYMTRAEKLKEHIQKINDKKTKTAVELAVRMVALGGKGEGFVAIDN